MWSVSWDIEGVEGYWLETGENRYDLYHNEWGCVACIRHWFLREPLREFWVTYDLGAEFRGNSVLEVAKELVNRFEQILQEEYLVEYGAIVDYERDFYATLEEVREALEAQAEDYAGKKDNPRWEEKYLEYLDQVKVTRAGKEVSWIE